MSRPRLNAISLRFRHVWYRNFLTYRRIWKVSFPVPLLEPAFYILAFGLGFSGLIGDVRYGGRRLSYTAFMAPALVATACGWNAFFETTYSSFVRMYYQKTFDGMLATPLSLEEVVLGESVWAASKSSAPPCSSFPEPSSRSPVCRRGRRARRSRCPSTTSWR